MYGISELKTAITNPHYIGTELNRLYHGRLHRRDYNPDGIDIFDEDWDTLVILDACRYDAFVDAIDNREFGGQLESRISRGSATREWIRANFSGKQLHDIVYVDSNGYYARLKDDINTEVYKYHLIDNDAFGGLSIHPDKVTKTARKFADEYPDKRLIVHYMQPHQPYFGPTGESIEYAVGPMATVRENDLDNVTVKKAYAENLEIVFDSVQELLDNLTGRVVITSDHGELLGDSQSPLPIGSYYGHPAGLYVSELVTVPWLVIDTGPRRHIREEDPQQDDIELDEDELNEKLRGLGYKV